MHHLKAPAAHDRPSQHWASVQTRACIEANLSDLTGMGFYFSIHQITSTFLASGLGLLWGSQQDPSQIVNVLALFVDLVILGNISVIVLLSRIKSGAD